VVDEHGGQRAARLERGAERGHDRGVGEQRALGRATSRGLVEAEVEQRRHHPAGAVAAQVDRVDVA
jgi:hypothetical protein